MSWASNSTWQVSWSIRPRRAAWNTGNVSTVPRSITPAMAIWFYKSKENKITIGIYSGTVTIKINVVWDFEPVNVLCYVTILSYYLTLS